MPPFHSLAPDGVFEWEGGVRLDALSHVGATVILGGYAPGTVTALAIHLPFSVSLLRRAAREHWVRPRDWPALGAAAVVLHGPVLLGVMVLAGGVASAMT